MEPRAWNQELRASSQALCPSSFALCPPLFFLKRHFAVINRVAHRYAVNVYTADDGFRSEFGILHRTAFNWLFENVLYQTSGHVVQIDTRKTRVMQLFAFL